MRPVFVFGTGRCGSTHLQRLISLSTDTWVWGEHDGFLIPVLAGLKRFENSTALAEKVFSRMPGYADEVMVAEMREDSHDLPWLNRMDRAGFRRELERTVDALFRAPLPGGWSEWGFKEILYGLHNDVPEQLLDLFPLARAAFTFRHPKTTLWSMIASWTPDVLKDVPSPGLAEGFEVFSARWQAVVTYFLALKASQRRLVFLSLEEGLQQDPEVIFKLLDLRRTERRAPAALAVTNPGVDALPKLARDELETLYEKKRLELEGLYARAVEVGRADLAGGS